MPAALDRLDWNDIADQLHTEGQVLLPGFVPSDLARSLIQVGETLTRRCLAPHTQASGDRAWPVSGRGELRMLGAVLPDPLQVWRSQLYRHLAVIANRWHDRWHAAARASSRIASQDGRQDSCHYPAEFDAFQAMGRAAGRRRPLSHLSRLGAGDYLGLRRGDVGPTALPMQVVALLNSPGTDFLGGEFVMTEQRPRMQSRPMVLPLRAGDAAIICVTTRPVQGRVGDYRVTMRHAISPVRDGTRLGLELSFHDGSANR